jgi:tRNA-2-methylthio-N6-dimethylallyladenosine synthase
MTDTVPLEEKRPWLPRLQELQNGITAEKYRAMEGREEEVLVESVDKKNSGYLEGRTRTNYIVHFPGDPALAGRTVRVRITSSRTIHLFGEMVN